MDGGQVQGSGSLWRLPAMQALLAASLVAFTSFALTLSALPSYAAATGAGVSTAGLVTTIFLALTVGTQAAVPRLVAAQGLGRVYAVGLLALGLPAPFYLVDDSLTWLCVVSAVRGIGFGIITVLGSTITAQAVPPARRGEALGIYGLAAGIPMLAAVPAGVALTLAGHFPVVAWLSAAPLLGLLVVPALVRAVPGMAAGAVPAAAADVVAAPAAPRSSSALVAAAGPSAVLLAVTLAGAGLLTFLPIVRPNGSVATVGLLLYGIAGAVSRLASGVIADRVGASRLLPVSLLLGAVGLVLLAVGLSDDVLVLIGSAVLGTSFGAVQNTTIVVALDRAGERGTTTASAVWNAAYDSGTALGAILVGVLAAGIGLPASYAVLAALLVLVLPLAIRVTRRPR